MPVPRNKVMENIPSPWQNVIYELFDGFEQRVIGDFPGASIQYDTTVRDAIMQETKIPGTAIRQNNGAACVFYFHGSRYSVIMLEMGLNTDNIDVAVGLKKKGYDTLGGESSGYQCRKISIFYHTEDMEKFRKEFDSYAQEAVDYLRSIRA